MLLCVCADLLASFALSQSLSVTINNSPIAHNLNQLTSRINEVWKARNPQEFVIFCFTGFQLTRIISKVVCGLYSNWNFVSDFSALPIFCSFLFFSIVYRQLHFTTGNVLQIDYRNNNSIFYSNFFTTIWWLPKLQKYTYSEITKWTSLGFKRSISVLYLARW